MPARLLSSIAGLFAACVVASSGQASDPAFYAGKRLTVLINFEASGPTDIEGRLFAKYLAKNLDGQPPVIVQNMDGAGGLIGAQYLGEVAPKDGTVVGYLTGTAWRYASEPNRWRTDYRTYEFLASHASTTIHFARSDVPPGLKQPSDVVNAVGLIAGGLNADASKDLRLRLGLDMLGVKYKYVTGYRSSPPARLALQRGEIHVYSESPPAYRSIVVPTLINTGVAIPLFIDEIDPSDDKPSSLQLAGLDIPTFRQLYRQIKGGEPSGQLWEAYKTIFETNAALTRIVALPPKAPKPAIEALRKAILALEGDKEFAAEAMAIIGFVPDYKASAARADEIRQMLVVDENVREFIRTYTKSAAGR
jgi:tripartite-type tricarboxylate transporter receptor subunit TctC